MRVSVLRTLYIHKERIEKREREKAEDKCSTKDGKQGKSFIGLLFARMYLDIILHVFPLL